MKNDRRKGVRRKPSAWRPSTPYKRGDAARKRDEVFETRGPNLYMIQHLLQFIGEDYNREGLRETPRRVLEAWKFWTSGYDKDPATILKTFADGAKGYDELICQGAIPVWSMCEHHMAPFFGVAHIAYIPKGRIVGLSKMPRLVDIFARRLQVQERLTHQIADAMNEHLKPKAVGVVLRCRHTCIESRGVQKAGSSTTTSALFGLFKTNASARAEFLKFVELADAKATN